MASSPSEEAGVEAPPYISKRWDDTLAVLRDQLDEGTLTDVLKRGRELSLDAAVDLAQ